MTRVKAGFVLCTLLGVSLAMAQQSPVNSTDSITVQGNLRARMEVWNWFEPDSGVNNYVFSGNALRLSVSRSVQRWDWQAELAAPSLLGLPDRAARTGTQGQFGLGANYFLANHSRNTVMVFPKQLFFRWKDLGGVTGQSLRLGRFEFGDGAERAPGNAVLAAAKREHVNQRLIGTFAFTHVGRSFDGVQYSFNRPRGNFTVVAAIPTRGVFQTDGWGWNRVGFSYAAFTREWGTPRHAAESRLFVLEYADWRHVLKADNRPAPIRSLDTANIRIETFGGHTLHAVSAEGGLVDVLAWGTVQTGRWGAEEHRAWAVDFEAGFQPEVLPRLNPWLRGGFTRGSGDGNPDDNKHATFFQALPTPRLYARFPFFNMMNTEDRFASIVVSQHDDVTLSGEFHSLRLASKNDHWYSGGGVYQPWTFGYAGRAPGGARSLANLYDLQAEYRLTPEVTVTGYFGYAQGLGVPHAIYPRGKDGAFGYIELNHRF